MNYAFFAQDLLSLRNDRINPEDADRQERTAREILARLDRQPGVILADEVGMGKTFVALAVAVSVVINSPEAGPVVVMVPASLRQKWPRDWDVFRNICFKSQSGRSLRVNEADSGIQLLKLLDDPPERKSHIIFLTHGALHRSLSDGWAKLALIKRAFKKRYSLSAQRKNFHRFAGSLLRMGSYVDKKAPGLLGRLLDTPCTDWLQIIHRALPDLRAEMKDDPVPHHLEEVLESFSGKELEDLVEAIRKLPVRTSANLDARITEARGAISRAMEGVWRVSLRQADFRSPLLILDEAHHLKNPATRLASLFVDEIAAQESRLFEEAGPLGGKFDRMLFLTATPFQLGHAELLRVLERFEGITWSGATPPSMSRAEFREELHTLGGLLDQAQASALRLDRVWGRLRPEILIDADGKGRTADAWWSEVAGTMDDDSLQPVFEQVQCTREAMRKAESLLAPWVLRHLKSAHLPGFSGIPRRVLFPGASIRDGGSPHSGLTIDGKVLLPFLLAGRAQKLLAASSRGRALFSEGLASSFEAYLDTRSGGNGIDEDSDLEMTEDRSDLDWYLRQLDRALPQNGADRRSSHPKILATAERVVGLWRRGEKVLVFCHYRATGRALRQHISNLLQKEIISLGKEKLANRSEVEIVDHLDSIGRRFFDTDGPLRREITDAIFAIVKPFQHGLSEDRQDQIVEVVRRFLRTHSFLVRYFPLNRDASPRAFVESLDSKDMSGLSLRQKILEFCKFLADRCIDSEREEYLNALEKIQTGAYTGKDVRAVFDPAEARVERDTALLPNVRLANGEVREETRRRLLLAFNTPLFPEILIASSVLAEGVDLHLSCRYVIHHDLCWNPSTLEQRSGRVDRIGSKSENVGEPINLFMPYVAATQDEKMYKVVKDRERWFQIVMGEKYEVDEMATDRRADRIELPEELRRELSLKLNPVL
jgi:hypothetical protein